MKKSVWYILLGCWCLLPVAGVAQYDVEWGNELKVSRKNSVLSVPGSIGGNTFVVTGDLGVAFAVSAVNRTLHQVGPSMNVRKSIPLDFIQERNNYQLETSFVFQGELFIFFSFRDARLDRKTLYVQQIDGNSLALVGEPRTVSEIPSDNRRRSGAFSFEFSRDSSYLMIHSNLQLRKNEPEEFNIQVFGGGIELVWEKQVRLPYEEGLFVVEDFQVDNEGNAYLLGTAFKERARYKRRGEPNYTYEVFSYFNNGEEEREMTISLGDEFITDMLLEVAPNGDLITAGFYSERGTFSMKGAFFQRMDGFSSEVVSRNTREFGLDFVTQYFSERAERKARRKEARGNEQELFQYDLRDIIPRGDGGSVLVAEQFFIREVRSFNPQTNNWTVNYYYYYNDIIVVSISSTGEIEWASKVPKRQVSVNDGGYYSSYAQMITNGKLYFVYNDHVDNLAADGKNQKFKNFSLRDRKGIVVIATVDAEGNVERKSLLSNREIDTVTRPKRCRQLNRNDLFLYARRRRTIQYGQIAFQ